MQKGTACQAIHLTGRSCHIGFSLPLASPLSRLATRHKSHLLLPCLLFSAGAFHMDVISDAAHRVAAVGPRTTVMLIVAVVFLILSWISFALRVYVRAILLRSFGWDDWTMLLTICLSTTCCSLLMCIERIENGDRPQRALEEGIRAQIDLLNYLMKVCDPYYTSCTNADYACSTSYP